MASSSSVIDTFSKPTFSMDIWQFIFGSASIASGQLKLDSSLGGQYSGLTAFPSDFTSSSVAMMIQDAGNQLLASWEVYVCQVYADSSNGVHWLINQNTVYARIKVAGVTSVVGSSFAYNPSLHKWFMISESGGTFTFRYSSNGIEWTDHTTLAVPFTLTSVKLEPTAGNYAVETSTTSAYFDNINALPARTAWLSA